MSTLDGTIRNVFGSVFGAVWEDGVFYKATGFTKDAQKTLVPSGFAEVPCKVQEDSFDATYLAGIGLPLGTSRFLILREQLGGRTVDADDEIEYNGRRFRIMQPINSDPAHSYYDVAARLAPTGSP